MSFARPELLALAPLAVLVVALSVTSLWRRRVRLADAFGGPASGGRLAGWDLVRFPSTRLASLVVVAIALAVAAAEPEPPTPEPASQTPIDVVVAVDLSLSMSATDVEPSRAARATEVVERLVEALGAERVGLEVFADWPYTLVPMTDDPAVVRFFAASLDPARVGERDQGSDLAEVVAHARRALDARRREGAGGAIVLLTDGEVHDAEGAVLDSVAVATRDGVRLWTAGVGTGSGGPVPAPGQDGAPLVEGGVPVVSRMNADLLGRAAQAGGGAFHDVSDDAGVDRLIEELGGAVGAASADRSLPDPAWWLTLLGLVALVAEGVSDRGRRPTRAEGRR